MTTRESFVKHFGEAEACRIEAAAEEHKNGINSENYGSDHFRWCITIVIGHQCAEAESFRKYHEITSPWEEIKQWITDYGDLENHDGDVDYLSLLAGEDEDYMPERLES